MVSFASASEIRATNVATGATQAGPAAAANLAASPREGVRAAGSAAALGERTNHARVALRRTWDDVPSLRSVFRHAGSAVRATLPGLGLVAASGLAFAKTVTPSLLALSGDAKDLAETLRTVPVVGGMLARVLGVGGYFGLFGGAACLFSASIALLTGDGPWDKRAKWALAHVAQGFATSPFWSMAAAGTLPGALPGVLVAGACMLGVSLLLTQVLRGERPSWLTGVTLTTLCAAGGPLAGAMAGGIALATTVTSVGLTMSLGALVGTLLVWRSHYTALGNDSTALLRRYPMPRDPARVLPLRGTPPAEVTVFVDDASLHDKIASVQKNLAEGGALHNDRLLLCGPPGTGKSDVARALHNAFPKWSFYCPPVSLMRDATHPATKITEILDQAAQRAQQTGQPVALVFEEAEKLFPDRARFRDKGTVRGDALLAMTTTLNDLLDGVGSERYAQVFVVAITNHPEDMDVSIRSRFGGHQRVNFAMSTSEERRQILHSRWRMLQPDFKALARFAPFVPSEAAAGAMERACAPREFARPGGERTRIELSGRDIVLAVRAALERANAHFAHHATGDQAALETALRDNFAQAVAKHFADKQRDWMARVALPPAAAPAQQKPTAAAAEAAKAATGAADATDTTKAASATAERRE